MAAVTWAVRFLGHSSEDAAPLQSERITTTTPFADPAIVLAAHSRRLAAALLDALFSVLVVGGFGATGYAAGLAGAGGSAGHASNGWEELDWVFLGSFVGLLMGAVAWLVLIVWLVQRPGTRNGQTLGKQLVGIRAVRATRQRIGTRTALLREVLAKGMLGGLTASLVSTMLGFLDAGLIGFVTTICIWYGPALADEQRRALHDRLCGTCVIDAGHAAGTDEDLWPAPPPA